MKRRSTHGVSLIELMVALCIFAVLVLVGIPSYQQWVTNTRVRTAAESIQNGLRDARNEAVQRSTDVMFQLTNGSTPNWTVCLWSSGTSCPASGSSVLQTYTSSNSAADVLISTSTSTADVASGAYANEITGTGGSIVFNSLGRPTSYNSGSLIRIDSNTASTNTTDIRRLVTTISPGGEVNMCDPSSTFSSNNTQYCP
jgi:type IV fimbrial biogenesis protein FimT